MKKILCMVLTVVMLFTMIPADIMAEDTDTYENTVWSTDGVMALAADTTYESGKYIYTLDEDKNAVITGFTGSVAALVIPSELDGHEVTAIGDRVFKNNSNLRSVVIPDTVIKIGAETFYNCANLGNVTLSANLQEMGGKAFGKCVLLTDMVLPESLVFVDYGVFEKCIGLEKINIPANLKTGGMMGESAFYTGAFEGCEKLSDVSFDEGITTIPKALFRNCAGLKNIIIPDSVTTIEANAFRNCINLSEVSIPNDCSNIGYYSFADCKILDNVRLPKNLLMLDCGAFARCSSLKKINIPAKFKTSGMMGTSVAYAGAFAECDNLIDIEFEDGITTIPLGLFCGCIGLRSIELPSSITSIEKEAFKNCSNLSEVSIPNDCTNIGYFAFAKCTSLQTVQIPENLRMLDCGAFSGCKKLESINIPAKFQTAGMMGASVAYAGAFADCDNLTHVVIEDGRKDIPKGLFYKCTGIKNISIPESVTKIEEAAFQECINLEKIDIPDSVVSLGRYSFSGCSGLLQVKLSNNCNNILDHTFNNCTNLKSIIIPDEVTEILASAFENTGLEEIKIPDNTTLIDKNAFKNSTLKKAYISDGVTNIQDSAFYGCESLSNLVIGKNVSNIGNSAFYGCDMLAETVIPDSVTTLGTHVFEDCDVLENVTLGTGITTIPSYAFHQCAKLTDIVLPYRVTTVKDHAFTNCVKLKSITVPRATTMIDQNAFSYSGSMTMYGVDGTYAKTYADDVGMTFIGQEKKAELVSLKDTEISMNNGSKISLQMTVEPLDFTDEVTWKSTDTSVAEVDNSGVVTAKKIGSATIKVIVGDCSASCKVTVVQPVTRITLDCNSLTMESQEQYTLKTNISPNSASNKDLFWTSSDDKVATVDENGTITAISKGNAIITVQAAGGSDVKATCNVTVKNNGYVVDDISEMESTHNYENNCSDYWIYTKKGAAALKVIFDSKTEIEDGFDYLYIYDGSGENIGKYTGDQLAGATITVPGDTVKIQLISDDGGNAWGFKVTEIVEDSGYEKKEQILSGTDSYVKTYRDNDFTLDSRVEKGNGTLTFQSLNESVVTVNASGLVHINGAGSAKIKVTVGETSLYKSTSMEISITVNKAAQNIDAYLSNSTISIGESATIYASCDTGRLSFRSQNENVAVIDGEGTVIGKNIGTAVLRVTAEENNNYNAATKEFYITVTTAVSGETDQNNDSVDSPEENKTSADSIFEKNIAKRFNLKATALSAGKVKLKWKKVSKINGYQIRYATKSSMKSAKTKKISGAGKTGITLKGLKKGKKYYFQLRAYKKSGSKTYYSKWSGKVSKKVKK